MFALVVEQQCHKYAVLYILNSVSLSLVFLRKEIILPSILYARLLRIFFLRVTYKNVLLINGSERGSLIHLSYLS